MIHASRWLGPLIGVLIASCSRGSVPVQPAGAQPQQPTSAATPGARPTSTPPAAWVAYGDSITLQSFRDTVSWDATFGERAPEVWNVSFNGATSLTANDFLGTALKNAPEAPVGLSFGTNDAYMGLGVETYKRAMRRLIERVRESGRTPILALIPYSPHPKLARIPAYNEAVRELAAEMNVAVGPDLYAHFQAHPEQLQPDQIHLTDEGEAAVQRLWAEAIRGM